MKNQLNQLMQFALIAVAGFILVKKIARPPSPPVDVAIVLDATFKSKETKEMILKVFPAFSEEIRPKDTLFVFALDHKMTLEHQGPPRDAEAATVLGTRLFSHPLRGTDLASSMEALAHRFASPGAPVILIIFTDGIDDGEAEDAFNRTEKAAADLARNPRVRSVVIEGLIRDDRPRWKAFTEALAPLKDKVSAHSDISLEPLQKGYQALKSKSK